MAIVNHKIYTAPQKCKLKGASLELKTVCQLGYLDKKNCAAIFSNKDRNLLKVLLRDTKLSVEIRLPDDATKWKTLGKKVLFFSKRW